MFSYENAQFCSKQVLCQTPLCQFKHQNSSRQTLEKTVGNENEFDDTHVDNGTKSVRCNYGLCDLCDIMFTTKPDLHAHLQIDHGFDSDELEEL